PSGQPGCASDDLHALIEQLGLDPCHLVATAAGGAVAVDYTLSHPDRVSSLVLADCSGGARDAGYVRLQEIIRPAAFEAWPAEMREVGPSYRFSNPEGTQRWAEIDHASQQPDAPRQTPRNHITFELLTTLRTPTLVLTGDADLYSPPSMMRQLAAAIPGSQHVLLPEAGHAAFWEQPDTWNRLVLDFIRQH
ncbi:MAG TPA: alpha/beta hydrolase, partial [Chloroflexota bacterium]|nr:alpha/beta hydrolase [Chloroflexota bacterium]